MPIINKFRIVDFPYNEDNRMVADESFELFGDHTLMTLANGGGKTVLVQALMQPIIPMTAIGDGNRTFESVFKKNHKPAYILIEWLLDNNNGYITTGIAIRRKKLTSSDDEISKLEYYTFVLESAKTNLNIDNLPLCKKEGSAYDFISYTELRDILKREKITPYEEKSVAYKKLLKSFNIDTKEWKDIITKINSAEGGLSKLFENCKTSSDILNKWILDIITKNISDRVNLKDLRDQTQTHISKVRKKINEKNNKAYFSRYIEDLNSLKGEIEKIKINEDKIIISKNEICNIQHSLEQEIKTKTEKIILLEEDRDRTIERLNNIEVEELSLKYYAHQDKKEALEIDLQGVQNKIQGYEKDIQILDRLITSLKVADIKEQIHSKEDEREELEVKIRKLSQEQSEIDLELNNVGYSIGKLYEEKLLEYETKELQCEKDISNTKEQLTQKNSNYNEANERYIKLDKEISQIQSKIAIYKAEINNFLNEINIDNLLIGIDPIEVTKEIVAIETDTTSLIDTRTDLEKENINLKDEISKNIQSISKFDSTKENLLSEKARAEGNLEKFHSEMNTIKHRLSLNDINDFDLSDKQRVISVLEDSRIRLSSSIKNNLIRIEQNKIKLDNLLSGGISICKEFLTYLDTLDIKAILGSDYLKNSIPTEDMRLRLLNDNPVLPYSIILEDRDIEYLKNSKPSFYYENPILIVSRENLNALKFETKNKISEISKGISIVSLYNKDLVIKENIETEINIIKGEIASLEDEILSWEKQKNEVSALIDLLETLNYKDGYDTELTSLIKERETSIYTLVESIKALKNTQEIAQQTISSNTDKINDITIALRDNEYSIKVLTKIKGKLNEVKEDDNILQQALKDIKVIKNLVNECAYEKERLENTLKQLEKQLYSISTDKGYIKEKKSSYNHFTEGIFIEDRLDILESRYKALESKANKDELLSYKERISSLSGSIDDLEKRLVVYSDYDLVKYDFKLLTKTEEEFKTLNKTLTEFKIKSEGIIKDIQGQEKRMNEVLEKIKEPYSLVEKNLISSNLENEKKHLVSLNIKLTNDLKSLQNEKETMQKLVYRIVDSGVVDQIHATLEEKHFKEIYTDITNATKVYEKLTHELNILFKEKDALKEHIGACIRSLITTHSSRNTSIDTSLSAFRKVLDNNTISSELQELINRQIELIDRLIEKLQVDLDLLDNAERFICERYIDIAKQYTEELKKFDKNSVLTLQNKKLKMLELKGIKEDDTSEHTLKIYIKEQLDTLSSNLEIQENNLIAKIETEFKVENLLRNYCRTNNISIKFMKIEGNISHSEFRTWEQVLGKNSGAERFLAYFVLFSALLNYSRNNYLNKDIIASTLIMDNPFSDTSSEHILIPVFEFAKKSHIQLICFSDHMKSDILDRFNIIYSLCVKSATNGKEFVDVEKTKNIPERLEKGLYRYNEQITLY